MPTSSFNLSDLDGSNGFVINGLNPGDRLGLSVSGAGDINGDGIDDLIIGTLAYRIPNTVPATTYVLFGGTQIGTGGSFDLLSLDGSNGFAFTSSNFQNYYGIIQPDGFGYQVSDAGDINADGFADLIVSTARNYYYKTSSLATSYVLLGSSDVGFGGRLDTSALDGSNGFTLNGSGADLVSSAGDINGDGIDDLILGESIGDFSYGKDKGKGGYSYVVFGGTDLGADGSFDLSSLDGSNGFRIDYKDLGGGTTNSVSGAGDINGDGFADLIIGVPGNLTNISSKSYVVFGGTNVAASGSFDISALDGSNGFVLDGAEAYDNLGFAVSSAGDINGDGIDDLIIGAPGRGGFGVMYNYGGSYDPYARNDYSKSYVLFGGADIALTGSDLWALDGSNGFVINGIGPGNYSGRSVSNAGDINGDGIDDLMIGAPDTEPESSGSTYIVFGGTDVGAGGSFELSSLDGSNGFVLNGFQQSSSGLSISGAGDINADGIDDVIIGAPYANSSYVVFGSLVPFTAPTPGDVGTNSGSLFRGSPGYDLIYGRNGNDTLLGYGESDTLVGANGNDRLLGYWGSDTLIGGSGDDRLFGGWGFDRLTGGVGSDKFFLAQNTGTDTITDFESGIDSLVLLGSLTFEQLTITQSNDDTLLSLASNNQVIANLTGIQADSLTVADFIII